MAPIQKILASFFGLLAVFGLTTASRFRRDQNPVCIDPPMEQLQRLLVIKGEFHQSFMLFPKLQDTVQTLAKFEERHPNMVTISRTDMQPFSIDCSARNLPAPIVSGVSEPCPVDYVFNYDPNRVPDTLVEARCRCSNICFGLNTTDSLWGCHPVTYFTKVLRKTTCHRTGDTAVYEVVWEPVTAACACRGPSARASDNSGSSVHSSNPGPLPSQRTHPA